jgi:hypothetical protein
MIDWICDHLIGGPSLRWRMTILYMVVFVVISLAGKMDAVAFGTFSTVFSVWIISDTVRKPKK